jgi:hypothetical protein
MTENHLIEIHRTKLNSSRKKNEKKRNLTIEIKRQVKGKKEYRTNEAKE